MGTVESYMRYYQSPLISRKVSTIPTGSRSVPGRTVRAPPRRVLWTTSRCFFVHWAEKNSDQHLLEIQPAISTDLDSKMKSYSPLQLRISPDLYHPRTPADNPAIQFA